MHVLAAVKTFISFVGAKVAVGLNIAAGVKATMAIGGAVIAGAALAAKKVMGMFEVSMPKIDTDSSRQSTVKSTTEPYKVIYGETLVSGPIFFAGTAGTDNQDLYYAIALAGHEVESITDIHFDNIVIPNADINSGNAAGGAVGGTGTFSPKEGSTIVRINKHKGESSQTADSLLTGAFSGSWTTAHRARGIAYIVTKWTLNSDSAETWDKFTPRNIMAKVKGRKIYDPRKDSTSSAYDSSLGVSDHRFTDPSTWDWSDNPALCLADYLTAVDFTDAGSFIVGKDYRIESVGTTDFTAIGASSNTVGVRFTATGVGTGTGKASRPSFGMGIVESKIDWDAVATAADGCDVSVDIPDSATEKRFTANGVVFGTDSHRTNIDKILSAMNGNLTYVNGKYVVRAGIYEAHTVDLDEDDLIDGVSVKTSLERGERFNTVKGLFLDPDSNNKTVEFPKVQLADALSRDNNEELHKEIALNMTNSSYMAQRIANKLIQLSDQQKVIVFPANMSAVRVSVGDRVRVTIGDLSFSNKVFQCVGWTFNEEGGVNLTLREDDSNAYADPLPGAYSTVASTGLVTDGFRGVPGPSGLRAVSAEDKVFLDWVNPGNPQDFETIHVFAGTNNDFDHDSTVKVGETDGSQFTVESKPGATDASNFTTGNTRYFWVRAIKFKGTSSEAQSGTHPGTTQGVEVTITATAVDWGNVADPTIGLDLTSDTISIVYDSETTQTGQGISESGIGQGVNVSSGGITMTTGGSIKGGQTAYDTGTGFFLGYDVNKHKFSIGNSNSEKLTFDGTNLSVTGALTATSLAIEEGATFGSSSAFTRTPFVSFSNIGQTAYNPAVSGSQVTWTQVTGSYNWNHKLVSDKAFKNGAFVSFRVKTAEDLNTRYMVGLADANTGTSYTQIDYAIYIRGSASTPDIQAYESGSSAGDLKSTLNVGDVCTVLYDDEKIKYIINGVVERTVDLSSSPITAGLYAHIAIDDGADNGTHTIEDFRFGSISDLALGVTIQDGGITMADGGSIKGGQTGYDSGTGFFLGYDSAYKFSIGNSGGNKLTFDGSDLTVTGAVNATSGDFSGQVAVGSTAGTITVIDGNDTDYRLFTNATLDTDTNQYLPDDSSFKVGNDGRVFASNITIYNDDGDVLLSPSGLGAAALNDISTTSGSVVSTVGGTVSNSTSEITLTTSSANESFTITSKVAIDDNNDLTQYFSGASTSSTSNAEAQLTGVDILVDYYVKADGGSYGASPNVTKTVTIVNSGTPTSTEIRVGGFDRGSSYGGSLTRYFAIPQDFGGALEIISNNTATPTSSKYVVTTATLNQNSDNTYMFPTAQTYKIKIVMRVVEDGTTTVISGSTTPPSSDNTTTGIYFDGGNSDERHYEITGTGLIKNSDNNFTSGSQNLLSSGGTISGDLVITGDLTVSGDTISANVGTLDVEDRNITLNFSTGDSSATADGAGITIQDAVDASNDATILWDGTNDEFDFSHGATFAGDTSVYTGASTGSFNVGRGSTQRFNLYVTDGLGYIRYYQDETGTTNHSVNFEIQSSSSGTNQFYFNKGVNVTGDLTASGIVLGSGTANDLQADGKTAFFGSAMFGTAANTNTPLKAIHVKGSGAQSIRIEDTASSNQIYDITSTFEGGFTIVDQTASITPLSIAYSTGNATFAGTIDSGAITSTGQLNIDVGSGIAANFNSGGTNVVARFESEDATAWVELRDSDSGTYGALIGHDSTYLLKIADADVANKFTLSNDGDGTFTGSVTSSSSSGGFFYAEDTNTGLDNDALVGGFLFKNNDASGTEPHYAGMAARTSNIYGGMSLEFFADRADYEADTPAMVLYADGADNAANTLDLTSSTRIINATSITVDDAFIGEWSANTSYTGLMHNNHSDEEYMILSADADTFISATTGGDVRIRGGNNINTYELRVYPDQDATASGNKIYHAGDFGTPLELTGGTLTGNLTGTNFSASGYMQAAGGFYNNTGVANNDGPIDTISIASGGSGFTDGVYANVVVAGGSYGRMRVTVSGGTVTGVEKASGGYHYSDGTGIDQSANLNAKGAGSGSGFTTNHTVKESLIHLYDNPGVIRFTLADSTTSSNQEIGSIRFATRDASTDGGGDVAQIVASARSTSGGGYLSFYTSYNGGEVYSDTAERLTLRLLDGNVYIGPDPNIWLRNSTDRSGLLENVEYGSTSYTGFQITRGDQHFSYMAHDTLVGLYDDTNGDWAYQYDVNGGVRIYYNNNTRIETLSDGIDVHGGNAAQLREASATFASGYAAFDYYASTGAVTNNAGRLKLFSNAKTGWEPDQDLGAIEFYSNDTSGIGPRTAAKIIAFNDAGNGSTTTAVSGSMAFYTSAYNTAQVEALRLDGSQNAILENGHLRIGPDSGDGFNGNSFLRMQQASTSFYMQMKSDTDRDVGLLFGDTADDFEGGFIYSNTNDALSFYANNALSFTIDSALDVIFENKVRLGADTEHFIRFNSTSSISGATADTTHINGRQIDLYAYDDIYLRAGSADSIYLWSGADATLTLDSANDATFVGNVTISGNVLDFDLDTTSDTRGIEFDGRDALTADTADGYLRLNQSSEFTNGVYTPHVLRIDNDLRVAQFIEHQGDTNTYIRFDADQMKLYAGGRQMIHMDEGTNPDKLEFVVATTYTDSTGQIVASGNITAYASDRRLKTNIKPIENALSKIMSIRGVTYDWRDEVEELGFHPDRKTDCMGVIAQELEEAGVSQVIKPAPFDQYRSAETNWEHVSKSGENYKTVDYDKLTALCIQGIREQQEIINAQQEQINQLMQALEDIKNGDD